MDEQAERRAAIDAYTTDPNVEKGGWDAYVAGWVARARWAPRADTHGEECVVSPNGTCRPVVDVLRDAWLLAKARFEEAVSGDDLAACRNGEVWRTMVAARRTYLAAVDKYGPPPVEAQGC